MSEIWKPIPSTGGTYEASSLGRIRSVDRVVGHRWGGTAKKLGQVLTQIEDKRGYLRVNICAKNKKQGAFVHRLIARTFLADAPEGAGEVNHKDLNPKNNTPANLEWVTHSQNIRHAVDGLRFHARFNPRRARKMTPETVTALRQERSAGASLASLAKRFGIAESSTWKIVHGKNWA